MIDSRQRLLIDSQMNMSFSQRHLVKATNHNMELFGFYDDCISDILLKVTTGVAKM